MVCTEALGHLPTALKALVGSLVTVFVEFRVCEIFIAQENVAISEFAFKLYALIIKEAQPALVVIIKHVIENTISNFARLPS